MKQYVHRTLRLIFGLFVLALGSFLTIQANVGLAPWDAFSMGFSYITGLSYGKIVVLTGFVIIIIDFLLKEKIGFGTIINALLIGTFVDIIASLQLIPKMQSWILGLIMLLIGQFILCIGSYYYISAALGCGPRDALMVALGKRLPNVPIGVIRGTLEGSVLLIGWLLGAKVGIGTVLSVFGIGFLIQFIFHLFRFDVKAVKHENMADTIQILAKKNMD